MLRGFTRARQILRLTWCKKRQDTFSRNRTGRYRASTPSRFLHEAGLMTAEEYQAALREAAEVNGVPTLKAGKGKAKRPTPKAKVRQ